MWIEINDIFFVFATCTPLCSAALGTAYLKFIVEAFHLGHNKNQTKPRWFGLYYDRDETCALSSGQAHNT